MFLFIESLGDDDKQRLTRLYEKYSGRMFSAARKILGDDPEAEDAVQNAFISVSKKLGKLNELDEDATCGYMFTVVKNEAYMILRKRREIPADDGFDELSGCSDVQIETELRDEYEYAVKLIMDMDDTYRGPLYLCVVMGYTPREASSILKRSEATVRVQISRAKQMIANKLREAGYES